MLLLSSDIEKERFGTVLLLLESCFKYILSGYCHCFGIKMLKMDYSIERARILRPFEVRSKLVSIK
jgi:hypothetical protein